MKYFAAKKLIFLLVGAALIGGLFAFSGVDAQTNTNPVTSDEILPAEQFQDVGLPAQDLRVTAARIIRVALGFLGILALGLLLYGGFVYMTAGGDEGKVSDAKRIILNAGIGLMIILSSYAITSFVISKLVDATTGGTNIGENGGGGGGGGIFSNQLYVVQLPPAAQLCARNASVAVVFNRDVDISTISGNIIVRNASTTLEQQGSWSYGVRQNIVVFQPTGTCSPSSGNDCYEPNTDYTLIFAEPDQVRSLTKNPELTLNCALGAHCNSVNFKSGSAVDRLPPTISIEPLASNSIEIGSTVPVTVNFTDDNGLQNLSLYAGGSLVDSVGFSSCQQSGSATVNWPTAGNSPGQYELQALGIDFAGLSDQDSVTVQLRPSHCFNGVLETNLGEEQLGPPECGGECGACSSGSCNNNSDCASGSCVNGVCQNIMAIRGFSPTSGAPGTYVSILGNYFGTTTGRVFFARNVNPIPGNSAHWIEAGAPNCGNNFNYWTDSQIIVQVPTGTISSTPIKVESGSNVVVSSGSFTVNSLVRPALCSLSIPTGQAGDTVSLAGKNFGQLSSNNSVVFGEQNALVLQSQGNPSWSDTLVTAAVPGIDMGNVGVKVVRNGVESNSVKFTVLPGASELNPYIESVTPENGARGEYITILGKNFGALRGSVWFKSSPTASALTGELDFPAVCEDSVWQDNKILVKAPQTLTPGTRYYIQVNTAENRNSLFGYDQSYLAETGNPNPGICAISPSSGPLPLPSGQNINIYGDYFQQNASNVYFWGSNATSPASITSRPQAVLDAFLSINNLLVTPAEGTITGPVSVHRTSDNKISNSMSYAIADCTSSGNACVDGYHCCASGNQKGQCLVNGTACSGETRSTGYIWRFSTREIPPVPRVVERCDQNTENGLALPSPSPSISWDSPGGDSYKVCKNALVTVEFSAPLDEASVDASTVRVNRCGSLQGNNCMNPVQVPLDSSSFTLYSASQTATSSNEYLSISSSETWASSTWYQVVLSSAISSPVVGGSSLPLSPDRPCGDGTAYCFYFQGGGEDCGLKRLLITPVNFWTDQLESPMKRGPEGARETVSYRSVGLSNQKCIMTSLGNFSLNWQSQNNNFADIYGANTRSTAEVSALANTVGVGLPGNSVNIDLRASTGTQQYSASSPLTIDLTDPKVIDWWPKCQEACTNAEVAVKFNVSLSTRNLSNNSTVRLLRCNDENCFNTTEMTAAEGVQVSLSPPYNVLKISNASTQSGANQGVNLVTNGFAEMGNIYNFPGMTFSSETHGGNGSFLKNGDRVGVQTTEFITVDPEKTYTLVGWAKSGTNGSNYNPANRQYFGIAPYDADKQFISTQYTMKYPGSTDTTLVEDLEPGDTTVTLANASGWYSGANYGYARQFIWYGYKNSQGYTYPDYTYSRYASSNFPVYRPTQANNYADVGAWAPGGINGNVITLRAPWPGPVVPRGTAVRNAYAGGTYKYIAASYAIVPNVWTRYSGTIGGIDLAGTNQTNRFPYGTEFARIIFLYNYHLAADNDVRWSDIWFGDPSQTQSAVTSGLLQPNTLYKVVISASSTNPLTAINQIWSRGILSNPSSFGKPFNEEFSWRFRTKDVPCAAAKVEVDPKEYSARSLNDRSIYSAVPYSSPDACSGTGQKLNAWNFDWDWRSSDVSVASVARFLTSGKTNFYCSASCVKKGSEIPANVQYTPIGICGNGRVEAGEDCDGPSFANKCGLDCRFMGTTAPTCGNGVIDRGESCDINHAATKVGCSSECLNMGSSIFLETESGASSLCGNKTIGSGEDCDIGTAPNVTDRRSSLGCTNECVHAGTDISSRWCYDNRVTFGGFKESEYRAVCQNAVSRCGDGVIGPEEDAGCDLGGGSRASWCNDYCLNQDAAHQECVPNSEGCDSNGQLKGSSLTYSIPSVCGDGSTGMGEESICEQGLNTGRLGVFDPWVLVMGVGQGAASGKPPAQKTTITATVETNSGRSSGSGEFSITCGYKSDAECSAVGVNFGVGKDSCCYLRPRMVIPTVPADGAGNVCLNSLLVSEFNISTSTSPIDPSTLAGNIIIARGLVNTSTCFAGERNVTSEIGELVLENEGELNWLGRIVRSVKKFFTKILGGTVFAQSQTPSIWCAGSDNGNAIVENTPSSTSKIVIRLTKPLLPNTSYAILMRPGIRDVRGVSIGQQTNPWTFRTGGSICEVDSLAVSPKEWNFSASGATTTLTAYAKSSSGLIQQIPGIYSWEINWQPRSNPFVTVPNSTSSAITITAQNRNGELDIRALARITENKISSATGTVANDKSHITVFLCENPWPPKMANGTDVFPYEDSPGNRSGYDLVANVFNGSSISPSLNASGSVSPGDGYFNFSTHYCADKASTGVFDDYPYLKPAVQNRAADLTASAGFCELSGDTCNSDSTCTEVANDRCVKYSAFKRFIFTNDKNSDGIGIQIFPNPKHLSPEAWFRADKDKGGQGFGGEIRNVEVAGYKGVSNGNNTYVGVLNYASGSSSLYDLIYLFSINENASDETKYIYNELLKNLRFNTNLQYNDGYCGPSVSNPSFDVKCESDLDCPTGEVCSNQVAKLQRNYRRYNDLKTIDEALERYKISQLSYPEINESSYRLGQIWKIAQTSYPTLSLGSYISGQTLSTWPSWVTLSNSLNQSLPKDPINKLGKAGTCKNIVNNVQAYCISDNDCSGTGNSCLLHDEATGWSDTDRRFSFACSPDSLSYRFFTSSSTFSLRARFEDPGLPSISNINSFVDGFGFSSLNRFFNLYGWTNLNNPYGICDGAEEISTLNNGVCGDGVVNRTSNEECDPPGTVSYDRSSCTPTGGNAGVKTCSNSCRWVPGASVSCKSLSQCGNGILESGESCDDGAFNGRYNHCNLDCTGRSNDYCGDGEVTAKFEICDTGTPGSVKYAPDRLNSCNWDCQSYGPYCGDGIAQTQNGEVCDGEESCTVNGGPGVRQCSSNCQSLGNCVALSSTNINLTAAKGSCGDGSINSGEVCDEGETNGAPCTPKYGESCTYCSNDCKNVINVQPTSFCGDAITDPNNEACDEGFDGNGDACNATYGTACTYCSVDCKNPIQITPSLFCGDGVTSTQYGETCDQGSLNGVSCSAGSYGNQQCTYCGSNCKIATAQPAARCGDSITQAQFGEVCDSGNLNGTACTPNGASCDYCASDCKSEITVQPPACVYSYSNWGTCQSNSTRTRNVLSFGPTGCVGTPTTTEACTYIPPCSSFTYASWGACQPDGTQTRTVISSSPAGCTGGTPTTTQNCTYYPPCGPSTTCGNTCLYGTENYTTGRVGSLCWFTKNLNIGTMLASASTTPSNDSVIEKWCYGNNEAYCSAGGGFYTWAEAMQLSPACNNSATCSIVQNHQGICPSGWHVANDNDFKRLEVDLGLTQAEADSTGWRGTAQSIGTQLKVGGTSGFDARLPGYMMASTYNGLNLQGYFWTSQYTSSYSWFRYLSSSSAGDYRSYTNKTSGFSVRCVKNLLPAGSACEVNADCISNVCQNNVCAETCTYTYSAWGACQPDGTQTRTIASALPAGCAGTPVLSQSCVYVPAPVAHWPLGETGPSFSELVNSWVTNCGIYTCPARVAGGGHLGNDSSSFTAGSGIRATLDNSILNPNNFSVALWFKPSLVTNSQVQYLFFRQINNNNSIYVYLSANPYMNPTYQYYLLAYVTKSGSIYGTTSMLYPYDNSWKKLVLTYNYSAPTNTLGFYINNSVSYPMPVTSTAPYLSSPSLNSLYIGSSGGAGNSFIGQIENVKFFNTTLNSQQVLNLP